MNDDRRRASGASRAARRRVLLPALAAGVLALAGGAPPVAATAPSTVAAQEPAPVDVLPPVAVELVRLDVVVSEKRGKPRAGLTREDFVVLEDGQPQEIVQFQAFSRPAPAPAATRGAPPPEAEANPDAEKTEQLLPARYVVLAVDDLHMEMASLVRARRAIERFIREDLRDEDQLALVTTSGAHALSQEFTTDRGLLLQTLLRLSPQSKRAEWMNVPYLTDYQAELIEAGDPLALDAAIQEIMAAGTFQDADTAEQEARRKARLVLSEAVYNSRLTLETLERLCRGLSSVSGRKAIFFVSDGFVTGLTARTGSAFDVRRITDAATRAGVVVYTLDTRGLIASPPSATASSRVRTQPATVGLIEAMRRRGDSAALDAMNAMSADTGGFLVENNNDLRSGLREMAKDTETYYVLAYEPANTKRDGAYRKIEVKLPAVRGVKVRTRSGYFAPDERRLRVATSEEDRSRREEQRRSEMLIALSSLAPLSGIPVRLSADFVSLESGVVQLVVSGSVDVRGLPFARVRGRRQATLESVAVVYDEQGEAKATLPTERSEISVADADFERLAREGVVYQRTQPLAPGRYQVRLATREDATGLLGSAWQWVEIPDLAPGRLALSSLFLLREGAPAQAPAGSEAELVLQNAQARRRFRRDESLYAQLYAYNPRRDPAGAVDLVSQAEVLRKGQLLGTAAPEAIELGAPGGPPQPHTTRIRLRSFEPGDYELRVTVTDRKASAIVSRRIGFTVE